MRRAPISVRQQQQQQQRGLDVARKKIEPLGDGWARYAAGISNNISMDLAYKYNISFFFCLVFSIWEWRDGTHKGEMLVRFKTGEERRFGAFINVRIYTCMGCVCVCVCMCDADVDGWWLAFAAFHFRHGASPYWIHLSLPPLYWLDRLLQSVHKFWVVEADNHDNNNKRVRWWWHMMLSQVPDC